MLSYFGLNGALSSPTKPRGAGARVAPRAEHDDRGGDVAQEDTPESFDNFSDRKAAQLLHAFDTDAGLVLAHIDIAEKSNEIPAAQQLLGELQVAHCIVTLDALHCQKNLMWTAPEAASPISPLLWRHG